MATYHAESVFIASIYPGKLEPIRRNYGPSRESVGPNAKRSTRFELKPVAKGKKPFILELVDSFQNVPSYTTGRKEMVSTPVSCQEIADDVLGRWTGGLFNVPGGAKPGIILIAGTGPTAAELSEMRMFQTRYFEYLFNEGEKLHDKKQWDNITEPMRIGADWLGRNVTWANPAIAMDFGPCPLCGQNVANWVSVCASCGKTIRTMPAEIAALNKPEPPAVGK